MATRNVLILGAAGRDFHNFNVAFRDNAGARVVAFTATQIPNISDRRYPPDLAGPSYPEGVPIYPEADLERLIADLKVDECIFAYSDVSHEQVMHLASRCLAAGADFRLMGMASTAIAANVPVVSVCAARTGSGKSQTTRRVCDILAAWGRRIAVVRHPMPYGDLSRQAVQRFANLDDLDRHDCTIEEREEYEPHIERGHVVYAGVDYAAILHQAEGEADIVVWDGGNNDLPFYRPDLHIVVVDPLRPGHELRFHPGEANLRLADCVVINKVDSGTRGDIDLVRDNIASVNPDAMIIEAASPIAVSDPAAIRGKRVLVVEDGPTVTHGGMTYGAGMLAARRFGAAEVVDPRPYAVGTISDTYRQYPSLGAILPAMGYGPAQMRELQETIERTPADLVIAATPIDLSRVLEVTRPVERVRYELQEIGQPSLAEALSPLARIRRRREKDPALE
ncbi:MAG: GTPase [Anaerolineae bacterium]|nr:GTPase [Anaerolineae bacterium]